MDDDAQTHADMRARWKVLGHALGVELPSAAFDELMTRYGEPQRAYHNLQHLQECLRELDAFPGPRQPLVELALWFHDAIYDPRQSDNEAQSAALARQHLASLLSPDTLATIDRLILATRHQSPPAAEDEKLIVDIDLAILGQPPERFDAYDRAIRQEYAHVPEEKFRAGRAAVLTSFLVRKRIYAMEFFGAKYEARARANLQSAIGANRGAGNG